MRFLTGFVASLACLSAGAPAQEQSRPTPPKLPDAKAAPAVPPALDPANTWLLDLSTGGRVAIQLRPDAAPKAVERVKTLTRQRFYDGLAFHRVIDGFMAQGGDPKGDGTGGSPLPDVEAEFSTLPHVRGAVSAARADDPNSANSQFFIVFQPRLSLDRKYSVFGRVVNGMQYVDAIERGEPPANPSRVVRAYMASDNPPAYAPPPPPPAPDLGAPVTLPGTTAAPAATPTPAPATRPAPATKRAASARR